MAEDSVLIVGGAGYIGSHAAKFLHQKGYQPVVLDNLVYGHREAVKWGPFIEASIGDKDKTAEVMKKYVPVAVMHFGAYAYVGESVESPGKYYQNNVVETLNLLNTMLNYNVKNFVFSSSCAIFGEPESFPITEEQDKKPINPYGRTKWMVEQILDDYDRAYGLKSVCLRYFNAAGANPEAEIGELHNPETHLIPIILETALEKRQSVPVYGNDYPTEDGTCIRDYIHVTDLAQAHWLALEQLIQGGSSEQYNLGNGMGYSVNQVIQAAERVTGRKINTEYVKRRPGDPPRLVGSSEKIKSLLGWKPEFASLETIIETAWKWHQVGWDSR
jgi:UDP-glucose-4-epimerase GalE